MELKFELFMSCYLLCDQLIYGTSGSYRLCRGLPASAATRRCCFVCVLPLDAAGRTHTSSYTAQVATEENRKDVTEQGCEQTTGVLSYAVISGKNHCGKLAKDGWLQ